MNHLQKKSIDELYAGYKSLLVGNEAYQQYTSFNLYGKLDVEGDIVAVIEKLDSLDDDFIPITYVENIMIGIDGLILDMATVFKREEILSFIQTLHKLPYNE
jgi:hypothetical protein